MQRVFYRLDAIPVAEPTEGIKANQTPAASYLCKNDKCLIHSVPHMCIGRRLAGRDEPKNRPSQKGAGPKKSTGGAGQG